MCIRRLVFRENKAVHVAPLWKPRPRGEWRSSVQKKLRPGGGPPTRTKQCTPQPLREPRPRGEWRSSVQKKLRPEVGPPTKTKQCTSPHWGSRDPRRMAQLGAKKASPRGRASHKNKAVHVAPLWEPRPRGERRSSVQKKASAWGRASHESRLAAVAGINPPISLVGARALADPQPRFQARLSPAPALQPFHSDARPWPVADAAGERPELAWPGGSSEIRSRPH